MTFAKSVPLRDLCGGLIPGGIDKGIFVFLRGFIDDSGDAEYFSLSCLYGDGANWVWFEQDWEQMIEGVNSRLLGQGRNPISRYHANKCAWLKDEFSDWSNDEQRDITNQILAIFGKYPMHIHGYVVRLRDLQDVMPEVAPDPIGFANVVLMQYLMLEIGNFTFKEHPESRIGIIYERGSYDAVLQSAFNHLLADESFKYRNHFVSLTPMSWRDCTALQPADLFAYENFKDVERQQAGQGRRYTLCKLLELETVGGNLRFFNQDSLKSLKADVMDKIDSETKELLLTIARCRKGN